MSRTLEGAAVAASQAADAAAMAGVEVVTLSELNSMRAASKLFAEVWGTRSNDAQLPPELLRALVHSGNYAAGAFRGETLVGAVVGFLGRDADGLHLHSHILGVDERYRGANIGFALKQHQRAWALGQGLRKVIWTFDPLVRRNAYFNLQKLGARAVAYYESFYGMMRDGINAGDESDRLLVAWYLDDDRATAAASGHLGEPSRDGKVVLYAADGEAPKEAPLGGGIVVCETPPDVVSLRQTDPQRALEWRLALRGTLGAAMRDGYEVTGFTRSGSYVLRRDG